ncbi:hypothetical protein JDV02_000975 [Purpureocillium takamizusanense]|uniref:Uncharacterized protein n=1 Tax=Purpureocillium takamizusanense TaxID=2060973 RepID=A0A9Q8Q8C6_9HYPO|nr:uncharacterized protein JDV02_000975 [Purpureocillium takamizusanense]UNI14338.1 hypothetical protein JDV02_000975 [Purpureocillium takamizusanense]
MHDVGKVPCSSRNCDEHPRPAPALLLRLTPGGSTRDHHDSIATGCQSKATIVTRRDVFRRGRKQLLLLGGVSQLASLIDASRRGETAGREMSSEALERAIYTHSPSTRWQITTLRAHLIACGS